MATDINRASADELEQSFQVDRERAHDLIGKRDELGGFRSWDDVKEVSRFSDKMVENLQQAGLTLER